MDLDLSVKPGGVDARLIESWVTNLEKCIPADNREESRGAQDFPLFQLLCRAGDSTWAMPALGFHPLLG